MTDNPFEMPGVRNLAEENTRQAHAAYEQLPDRLNKTASVRMRAMPSPPATGLQDVRECAMEFAMDNAESVFRFAGKVCNAKSWEEVLKLQTQFAQDRMQAFVGQTRELQQRVGEALRRPAA